MVTESESEGGNQPGATRTLILGPDVKVYEELKKHSDEKMSYTYRIPVKTHDVCDTAGQQLFLHNLGQGLPVLAVS